MSFIYTHNTSPRRFKKVIKNKSYYAAVEKQNKLLRSLGIDPHRTIRRDSFKVMPLEQVGKLQTFSRTHLILQTGRKVINLVALNQLQMKNLQSVVNTQSHLLTTKVLVWLLAKKILRILVDD